MVIELSKVEEGAIHLRSGKLHWDIYSPKFDLKKGFEDLLRAAECENSEAMYLVGFAYLYGDRSAGKDEAKAYEWLNKAAEYYYLLNKEHGEKKLSILRSSMGLLS